MSVLKRSLALLSAALIAVSLGACGANGGTGKLEGNTYTTGFPIVKEKTTLKILTTKQPTQMDYNEMPVVKYLEEKTGIHVEWELASWGSEATQKIQLDFMSNNRPDVVSVTNKMFTDPMIDQYSTEGKIVDLEPYLEKWAPNIKKLMDAAEGSYDMSRDGSGKLTSLPQIILGENHTRYGNKAYIRKTWLDALGLEIPKTQEEFYNVLKRFKEDDPNGNGLADEIPLVFQLLQAEVFSNWGINYNTMSNMMMIDQNTGKWAFAPATDNMRDAIKFYSRLYDENLLNQKVIEEPARYASTIQAGNVGVFYNLANFTVCDYELAKEYVMLPPFECGDYPTNCYYGGFDEIISNNLVISSSCKNVEAALRWFDYFYTPAGYTLIAEGVPREGEYNGNYTLDEDGVVHFLDASERTDQSGTSPGGQMTYGYLPSFEDSRISIEKPDSELTDLELFNKYLPSSCTETYSKYIPKYTLKYPRATTELNTLMDDYGGPLKDYANTMLISFLIGVKNIDSEWGTYITELKRLNMDEIVTTWQEAYDKSYGNK